VSSAGPVTELLGTLEGRYTHAVVAFLDDEGYPLSVATGFRALTESGVVLLDPIVGEAVTPPLGREVNLVFSHIRPQPGQGYDERRYVSLWGTLRRVDSREAGDRLAFHPERVQHWDEQEMPFFEYSERGIPQAYRYMDKLSEETGKPVRPRLSPGWLFLRATRLPFLSATFVPVALGTAVAALHGEWHWWLALLTLVAASCVHLGLNVANDVFDTMSGADQANVTPTQFSGGSRVILYRLLTMRQMALMSAGFYVVGAGIGLYLAITRAFWPLLILGLIGLLISVTYTAPPLRLVHRGVGEIAVGIGFGPVMVLGAYYVQAQTYSGEAVYASIPVAILIALVLYVNEVPDRPGDAKAGKRTLPVRLSKDTVIAVYVAAVAAAGGLILGGAISGLLPRPTVIALAALPLAIPVYRALRDSYDSPYALMPAMAKNIQLHVAAGLGLVFGYVIAIVADHLLSNPPFFLR
jgi:1,4-dihydroxy-2-naphthoate polyprenyltransferase